MTYFAAALTRTEDGWTGREFDLDDYDDLEGLAEDLRDLSGDDGGPAILLLEEDDEYVGLVRVDGGAGSLLEPRVVLSDRRAVPTNGLAPLLWADRALPSAALAAARGRGGSARPGAARVPGDARGAGVEESRERVAPGAPRVRRAVGEPGRRARANPLGGVCRTGLGRAMLQRRLRSPGRCTHRVRPREIPPPGGANPVGAAHDGAFVLGEAILLRPGVRRACHGVDTVENPLPELWTDQHPGNGQRR